MSFWNFFKNKKKDSQEPDKTSISDESSLDLIFAKNFTESGGRFIYIDHENSTKDVFEKIIGENNWEIDNVCSLDPDISKNLDISSDPFFLGKNFVDVSLKSIKSDFGENFATYFNNFKINEWSDPVESAYGYHIILVINSNDGYYPDITVVLKQVEIDLLQSKRDKAVSEYLDNIKSEYKIYINPNLQI